MNKGCSQQIFSLLINLPVIFLVNQESFICKIKKNITSKTNEKYESQFFRALTNSPTPKYIQFKNQQILSF